MKAMCSVIAEEVTIFGFVKRQTEFWIEAELMDKSLDSFLYPVDKEGEDVECSLTQA